MRASCVRETHQTHYKKKWVVENLASWHALGAATTCIGCVRVKHPLLSSPRKICLEEKVNDVLAVELKFMVTMVKTLDVIYCLSFEGLELLVARL